MKSVDIGTLSNYAKERMSVSEELREAKIRWRRANRCTLKGIARDLRLSPSFVSDVFWEKRRTALGDVEQALKSKGAPMTEAQA